MDSIKKAIVEEYWLKKLAGEFVNPLPPVGMNTPARDQQPGPGDRTTGQ